MTDELLLLIGERIRARRIQKKITLDQLARRVGVTKGLISQIENNRTVPSLPVLFNIIHSLQEDIRTFFEELQDGKPGDKVIVVRNGEGKAFKKETVKGLSYSRLLTKSVNAQAIDVVLVTLKPGASRKIPIRTEAWECKHVLKGQVAYQVEKERLALLPGDTIFFNGRLPHRLKNTGTEDAVMLVIYFF